MGGVLNACKSTLSNKVKSTPETINETHLENDDKAYQHQRKFEDEFLKNREDLIQEITTNSKWQHHETRYLLSQFRKMGKKKDTISLTTQQFTEFVPILLKSFTTISKWKHFQTNKSYSKWLKHFIKLFSTSNEQITFQSFANTLSTACRGENNEKAQLLFDIFDIDGDGTFNENELNLFLYYILNINCIDNNILSEGDDIENNETNTTSTPSFDINTIIRKTQFIQYIEELISPTKPHKNNENDKIATNGQETKTNDDGEETNQQQKQHKNDENIDNIDEDEEADNDKHDDINNNNKDSNDDKDNDNNNNNNNNNNDDIQCAKDNDIEDTNNNGSDKSSDKDWEKIPLKKENNDALSSEENEDITNIGFLANTSLTDLKNADNATLLNTIKKLFKEKLYKKRGLKKEDFVEFASKSINFDNLFASFMIIPTRDDEKKIIKELMQSTGNTLGASWFVVSKEWWDKWCSYTGYLEDNKNDEKDNNDNNDNDESNDTMDNTSMAPKKRAMRPIKISNRSLLDENSYFTVLKKGLQENNEFVLLPKGAWEQLAEWYGGGPAIERFVICTDKTIRMKVIDFTLEKLIYDYQKQEKLMKEAMKKKKKSQKKENKKATDHEDSDSDDNNKDNKDRNNGIFDIDKFNREYNAFLEELSFTVHPDTLIIDLHPIYCNFVKINEKNEISDDSVREFAVSRYATLPELYINICGRMGYSIKDIEKEKNNYKQYLKYKLSKNKNKNKDNNNNNKDNKKNKKKDKDKDKDKDKKNDNKDIPKIALPPRMWTVIRSTRGGTNIDRLLYPIPKIKRTDDKNKKNDDKTTSDNNDKDKDKDKDKNDDNNNDNMDNPKNPTDDKPDNDDNNNNNNNTTSLSTGDGNDETPKDSVSKPAINETDDNNDNDDDNNDDINDENEDEIDLQTIGLLSGVYIAIEFAHPNKKKGGSLQYNLRSTEEDTVCQPEIDDSWLEFEEGDKIDGRDRWGKWYEAQIKFHKKPLESMPKKSPKLSKQQEKDIKSLSKLEGIYIHYVAWEEKWDEWIFIDPTQTICACRSICNTEKSKHRLAAPNTQSKYREEKRKNAYSSSTTSSRYHYSRTNGSHGDYGWGRGRESIRGTPSTAGCVGLVNLGNTCFMNSIIQCVSNTPHFRTFFSSGQYKLDINKSNPLGMRGELANEFARLVSDVWSGNYKVIAPRSLKRALSKFAPQFSGWQQHDSQEFLAFLLDGLHEDLNLVKTKPYTEKIESQGRTDDVVADLSWKIYLKRNKSKIVDLFQAQQKSHVICPDCNRNSITFDTYMYLSVPIVGHSTKSLIVDVFHRKTTNTINKPTRHVFHVNKYQKVRDLAKRVADHYNTKEQFVLFYENWNMKVAREYEHNLILGMVPNREALACYILKDWNEEVTPQDIKKKKLSLQLAKLCHSQPLSGSNGKISVSSSSSSSNGPLFGMPFVISFLNIHSRREVHQVIYQRLYQWVGVDVLKKPPFIEKLKKIKKKIITKKKDNDDNDDDEDDDDDDDDDEEEEEQYEYIRPSQEEMDKYESEWDDIFESIPYTLRLMPYRHYSFYSSKGVPEEIPIDDIAFEKSIRTKDIDIIIEWKLSAHNLIKSVVNKVVVDSEYSKWKKEKAAKAANNSNNDQLTLYDCINAYVAQETLSENDLWYCSECKKHEKANKKLDLWSFPEILIIHLKRFQVLGVGRFGRGEKISTFVECPIRRLDLSQYVINETNQTAPIYDLYAVSSHSGSCGGGHYTAYALNAETDRWYYFNDSSVRPAKESDIISSSTYVLFYKKCH